MTFSPSSATQFHLSSFNNIHGGGAMESGYSSGFSLSRPLDSFDVTKDASSLLVFQQQQPQQQQPPPQGGEVQTTPRTTAAINYMSALQLSTPRLGIRSGRKGTPLKRQQQALFGYNTSCATTAAYETTPKKLKSHENNENETSYVSRSASALKLPFRARLDRSLSNQTMSPLADNKLDCTFDAISSSTPICQPFRAEFYAEKQVEEIPFLTRSSGKNTRTKLIRKMQSFSPRKLMGLRAAKIPLREMDQNSVDFHSPGGLFPVEEEESSPIAKATGANVKKVLFSNEGASGAFSSGLRDLMFGTIKTNVIEERREVEKEQQLKQEEEKAGDFADLDLTTNDFTFETSVLKEREQQVEEHKEPQQETSSQLLDIYVTNLSNLDGGDSNSQPATAEDGDVSMVGDVERYFDELKRNTTQLQENDSHSFVPLTAKDSLNLYDMIVKDDCVAISEEDSTGITTIQPVNEVEQAENEMEVEVEQQQLPEIETRIPVAVATERPPPMLLRKRKRPSQELIQAVLATPKKMRRSQSFHCGDGHAAAAAAVASDENSDLFSSQRLSDTSNDALYLLSPTQQRLSGARKRLNYEALPRKRCSPAKRALAFDGVFKRRSLNGTAKLNIFRHLANCPPVRDYFFEFVEDRDLAAIYAVSRQCRALIEQHPRLNGRRVKYLEAAWRKKENENSIDSSRSLSPEETVLRVQGSILRVPLHSRNVDTSCASSVNETMSPPVSPSKRKFHENQKVSQDR